MRPRAALYMAAITAIRINPDMVTTYRRLRAEGKKHKVAVVAVMRKLVVLANILLRDDRYWSEERPTNSPKSAPELNALPRKVPIRYRTEFDNPADAALSF